MRSQQPSKSRQLDRATFPSGLPGGTYIFNSYHSIRPPRDVDGAVDFGEQLVDLVKTSDQLEWHGHDRYRLAGIEGAILQ
jgi:hypothetical protein